MIETIRSNCLISRRSVGETIVDLERVTLFSQTTKFFLKLMNLFVIVEIVLLKAVLNQFDLYVNRCFGLY